MYFNIGCTSRPYKAQVKRGGTLVSLGCFSTAEEADNAMAAMHGTMIAGKRLRIEKATAKQEMGIKESNPRGRPEY